MGDGCMQRSTSGTSCCRPHPAAPPFVNRSPANAWPPPPTPVPVPVRSLLIVAGSPRRWSCRRDTARRRRAPAPRVRRQNVHLSRRRRPRPTRDSAHRSVGWWTSERASERAKGAVQHVTRSRRSRAGYTRTTSGPQMTTRFVLPACIAGARTADRPAPTRCCATPVSRRPLAVWWTRPRRGGVPHLSGFIGTIAAPRRACVCACARARTHTRTCACALASLGPLRCSF
jgi:hypothetical protein